jgi:DinB family
MWFAPPVSMTQHGAAHPRPNSPDLPLSGRTAIPFLPPPPDKHTRHERLLPQWLSPHTRWDLNPSMPPSGRWGDARPHCRTRVGYAQRLAGTDERDDLPFTEARFPEFEGFAAAWMRQAPTARQALARINDPVRSIEWVSRLFVPPMRTRATGGIAGQLLFHEVHHRAQVMAMLRQAGVATENLDSPYWSGNGHPEQKRTDYGEISTSRPFPLPPPSQYRRRPKSNCRFARKPVTTCGQKQPAQHHSAPR